MSESSTDADTMRRCEGNGCEGNGMGGLDHSICPGTPVPETVLVVIMSEGNYLLVGYPQGEPSAFVIAEDAGTPRQALGAAFGSSAPTDQGGSAFSPYHGV